MRSASSKAPSDDADFPTLIGERYRVEAPLGRGGAAQLYRVVDLTRGHTLALKLLNESQHPKLRELFELEYQTLASLDHPRTPKVFEFGRDPRGVFYTMELLEGADLSRGAPLTWRTVCDHLRDASQALGLLHARSLIHRDVSPRNLWRTPDGRVKLIDFGGLAPFGPMTQIVGTPPFVPPEALTRRPLDQRADLYSLGAVAYQLLTGQHAYPARTLESLHEMWREPVAPPSQHVAHLARADLEPIPAELDALVLALLSGNELVRPNSTAEVIDRIDAMRGASPDSEREAAHARLTNIAYVGHARERRQLARRFTLAARGRGQACVIESAPGGGRTRALKELGLATRVADATVLYANAAAEGTSYGVANALALALLDTVPETARAAAEPHAPQLAHLSLRMRDRLGVVAAPAPEIAGELRVRMQEAQRDWFVAMARERPLVVLVDGLELADDGSVAFLLSLALALPGTKLVLVCTVVRDRARERSVAVRALCSASHSLILSPLKAAELHALLQSVFGAADHLARLSGRLLERTGGNPGHAIELCRQLIESGAITFGGGHWLLPHELDVRKLSANREQALAVRLSRVAGPARELARLLSVHAGPLTPGLCRALATSGAADLLPHLGELISAEIIVSSGPSLLFAHEQIRHACASELTLETSQRARRAIAEYLMASRDAGPLERLQAGVHWTVAGDARGPAIVARETLQILFHDVDALVPAAPTIEAGLNAFRERGCTAYEQVTLLAALALAGYEGDRRLVLEYGEPAVRALEAMFKLRLARKLSRYVGGTLSLLFALATAAAGFMIRRKNPCAPGFGDALIMLITSVACSAGARAICLDPDAASRFAEVLQPFAALGRNLPGGFMYEFCLVVADCARDRQYQTAKRLRDLLHRLETSNALSYLPKPQIKRCRGGLLYALASLETNRESEETLHNADELERNGLQFDRVCADQIRTIYYGIRGEVAAYERYRQRAEHHAIARGATWQVETWTAGSAAVIALLLHDRLAMKSAAEQMRRLSEHIPSLEVHARHLRGLYLLMRGQATEALPWLTDCLQEAPGSRTAWGNHHGLLARAYNQLGDHANARATCMRVFDYFTDHDFEYVNLNLIVQTERAIAEAGLGRVAVAREQLEQLHVRNAAHTNRLLRGQLFETGLDIALIVADLPAARHQLAQIEASYRPLSIPSLAQYCESTAARLDQLAGGPRVPLGRPARPPAALDPDSELASSFDRLRTGERLPLAEQAQRALRLVATNVHAEYGVLYLVDPPSPAKLVATISGERPSALVQRWVTERLARELGDDDERTVVETDAQPAQAPWNLMQEDGLQHRMLVFTTSDRVVVAIAVLAHAGDSPAPCPGALQRNVADRLYEALCDERTERSYVAVNPRG